MMYIASQGKLFQRALLLFSFEISKQLDMLYKLLKLSKTGISLAGADRGGDASLHQPTSTMFLMNKIFP